MLKSITLKNYLSYENTTVRFGDASSISVVGENGAGKSALLEASAYAYYGIGRAKLSGLSRINGDGSHEVIVENEDMFVHRGKKKDGAGFVKVYDKDGKLLASGSGAQDYIDNKLGMNEATFMLTAFFGLGGHKKADRLVKVTGGPAERLETLQKIAGVFIYNKLHKNANDKLKAEKRSITELTAQKEVLSETMDDLESLENSIQDNRKKRDTLDVEIEQVRVVFDKLSAKEEKYRAIVRQRDVLENTCENLDDQYRDVVMNRDALKDSVVDLGEEIKEKIRKRDSAEELLRKRNIKTIVKKHEKAVKDYSQNETMLSLKEVGISAGIDGGCPLCGAALDSATVILWKEHVKEINKEITNLKLTIRNYVVDMEEHRNSEEHFDKCKIWVQHSLETVKGKQNQLDAMILKFKSISAKKKTKNTELKELESKLGSDYDAIVEKLDKVNKKMFTLQDSFGSVRATIQGLNKQVVKVKSNEKRLKSIKQSIKEANISIRALTLLTEAWSRYGIPTDLLRNLNAAIEQKASKIYQEFDNGRIVVRDIDAKNGGVDFMLIDRKGERSWSQLSLGEFMMFYIAVRVAVAQIVAASQDIDIGFLVLDEGLANLSPKRRNDLIRLINKVLRKVFPQVLMVTHTEIPDIFDKTIMIEEVNDVSVVKTA